MKKTTHRVGLLIDHGKRIELWEGDEIELIDGRPLDDHGLPVMTTIGDSFALSVEDGYTLNLIIRKKSNETP